MGYTQPQGEPMGVDVSGSEQVICSHPWSCDGANEAGGSALRFLLWCFNGVLLGLRAKPRYFGGKEALYDGPKVGLYVAL